MKQAGAAAARKIEQVYRAPYLAHAALEPINCTAQVKDGKVVVWAPTQVPGMARALAAQVAGVPEDAVTVHVTYLGGGFGRRLDVDFVGQAVRIAIEAGGRPVQLLWSREEDMTHDFYRPASTRKACRSHCRSRVRVMRSRRAGWHARCPRWPARSTCPTRPPAKACST
jgi:isoquinoline 1-oxidoreductase subunit beta